MRTQPKKIGCWPRPRRSRLGVTLASLLLVAGLMAVLLTAGVGAFADARTRTALSQIHTDFRTMGLALDAYRSDHRHYPPSYSIGNAAGTAQIEMSLYPLTTPVAYLPHVRFYEPFGANSLDAGGVQGTRPMYMFFNYEVLLGDSNCMNGNRVEFTCVAIRNHYFNDMSRSFSGYLLWAAGPDRHDNSLYWAPLQTESSPTFTNLIYDPTNGAISAGDLGRMGGEIRIPEFPLPR